MWSVGGLATSALALGLAFVEIYIWFSFRVIIIIRLRYGVLLA